MSKATCSVEDCKTPAYARGFCKLCYGRKYRAGEIEVSDPKNKHSVSAVDIEARTGVCNVCGPVQIQWRQDQSRAVCLELRRQYREKASGGKADPRRVNFHIPKGLDPRDYRLRVTYGITLKDYDEMYCKQNGKCLLCLEHKDRLAVDHCHDTGKVRGLLCHHCNVALGHFRDDPDRIQRAVGYLRGS